MKIKRGNIFFADLSPVLGAEIGGLRYVVIVSNDELNEEASSNVGTVIVAPLSSNSTEVESRNATATMLVNIPELTPFSYQILLFGIRAIDVSRLGEHVGCLDDSTINELEKNLALTLGLCSQKTALKDADVQNSSHEIIIKVTEILRRLGIPADIPGYQYLRSAICLAAEDFDLIKDISALYSKVAIQHSATLEQVETDIYKAIEIMSDRADIDAYMHYFSYTYESNFGRPTNSECIAIIADSIKLNY